MTGFGGGEIEAQAMQLGCEVVVYKPIEEKMSQ